MDTSNWPRWAWWVIIAVCLAALLLLNGSCAPPRLAGHPVEGWPPDSVIPTPIQPTAMPDVFLTTLEIDGVECPCICRKVKDAK